MLESHRPSQSVVVARILASHRILIVTNVSSAPHPAFASSLGLGLRVDQRAHAMIVKTVGLHQVDDIEAILLACPRVRDAEVVPLGVASRVIVRLQDQIVFVLVHLDGSAQISRFKTRFKEECIVLSACWNVKWRYVACFCGIAGHGASVGGRVDSIVNDSIKEVLLVHNSFCFTPEALLKNELLWRIERLEVTSIFNVIWWVPHENTRGTTAKEHQSQMLDISYQSQHEAQTDALTFLLGCTAAWMHLGRPSVGLLCRCLDWLGGRLPVALGRSQDRRLKPPVLMAGCLRLCYDLHPHGSRIGRHSPPISPLLAQLQMFIEQFVWADSLWHHSTHPSCTHPVFGLAAAVAIEQLRIVQFRKACSPYLFK